MPSHCLLVTTKIQRRAAFTNHWLQSCKPVNKRGDMQTIFLFHFSKTSSQPSCLLGTLRLPTEENFCWNRILQLCSYSKGKSTLDRCSVITLHFNYSK
uniref:Uncharacterized protein n=1 Tax=Arundo donax TaxID=35708 RepID=A0A0A9BMD1_ARUDO